MKLSVTDINDNADDIWHKPSDVWIEDIKLIHKQYCAVWMNVTKQVNLCVDNYILLLNGISRRLTYEIKQK